MKQISDELKMQTGAVISEAAKTLYQDMRRSQI